MTLLGKIYKTSKIAVSTIKERTQVKSVERKIQDLEKKSCELSEDNKKNILVDKEILKRKADVIKYIENEKRMKLKQQLKEEVIQSREARKDERRKLKPLEKVQKEFKELPIVTIVDDIAEGVSGINIIKKEIERDEKNPYNWLMLADAMKLYNKAFLILNGIKAPIDAVGSIIDIGVQYLGEYFEAAIDKDKWTYEKVLAETALLCKVNTNESAHNLIILRRSEQLLAMETRNIDKKLSFFEAAEKNYEKALKLESAIQEKGEIYYYMAELWAQRDNKRYVYYLNQSIGCGFVPAEDAMKDFLRKNRVIEYKNHKFISRGMIRIKDFKYSLRRRVLEAIVSGTSNMLRNQTVKIANASERFFDTVVSKILK